MKPMTIPMRNRSMNTFPARAIASLPALSSDQMRQVDALMVAEYGIEPIQMMENAGRNLADVAQAMLDGDLAQRPVLVLAGHGNNGGGGLAAARHLANRGAEVQVMLARAMESLDAMPGQQLKSLLAMGVSVTTAGDGWELPSADLIIDALIGYRLQSTPCGPEADLIQLANSHPAPILALDAPSGVDAGNGRAHEPCIRAAATMMLALPKTGLLALPELTGALLLADISVPSTLYDDLGLDATPIFHLSPILRLHP